MNEPDLHGAAKLVGEAAAGATAVYLLHEGSRRPTRPGGYEGGLIPDPHPRNMGEAATFVAGGLVLRWVLFHVLVLPFLMVWGLGVMALPALALTKIGQPIHWYVIVYLGITALIGLRIIVGIFRMIDGRPSRRRPKRPVVVPVSTYAARQLRPPPGPFVP